MASFQVAGALLGFLGASLVAYGLLSMRGNSPAPTSGGLFSREVRKDLGVGFAYITSAFGLQALGEAGLTNPVMAGFTLMTGVFLYMGFLALRGSRNETLAVAQKAPAKARAKS